jgi:prepilin-type N-terminal cleavage/methylation domain-containing protein
MSRPTSLSKRGGFTLIEMLLSIGIFTLIVVAFAGIFVTITNVGTQQSSTSAVNEESQALLQKIQYFVETASVVNIPTSTPTTTLQLFMASSSADPTYITLASGTVYLQQSTSSPLTALTSKRVTVSNISFTRQSNPPGHDTVNVSFTMQNTAGLTNLAQSFSQLFQTSVVHVSAATFDTGVYASGINEPLGTAAMPWTPINGLIYTSGSNLGIGASSPAYPLDVSGTIRSSSGGFIFPNGTTQVTAFPGFATGAQVIAGTNTSSAVTAASLTSQQSIGSSGYYTLPGGLILEWGLTSSIGSNGDVYVAMPYTCTTSVYNISLTPDGGGGGGGESYYYPYSITTSGFYVYNAANTSLPFFYYVICK